jgi:hypothetical protein
VELERDEEEREELDLPPPDLRPATCTCSVTNQAKESILTTKSLAIM